MIKKTLLVLIFPALFAASAWAAPDRTRLWEVGANISARVPDEGSLSNAALVGGNVSYGINRKLGIGISGGWSESDVNVDRGLATSADAGTLTTIPLFLDLIFREPPKQNDRIGAFYAVMGVGGILNTKDENASLPANFEIEDKDGYALKLAIGNEWSISKNWLAYLELGYVFTTAELNVINTTSGVVVDSKELDYWFFGLGLRYLFD